MSPPDDVMCYKCNTVPGTEECVRTGYAICDQCNPFSYYNMLIKIKSMISKGKINSGMFPKLNFNDAEDAKIILRELCEYSAPDTIVQYGQTKSICHMFYRGIDNKCYSFYFIHAVTSPSNIYEITDDFLETL